MGIRKPENAAKMKLISVIVTTYNWAEALRLCLLSLYAQTDLAFEIIIADDGSRAENMALTQTVMVNSPVPIHIVYHEDNGFRAGIIRNKAVAKSQGKYLILLMVIALLVLILLPLIGNWQKLGFLLQVIGYY